MLCIYDPLYAKTWRSVRKINLRYSLKYTRTYTSAKNSTFKRYNPPSTYYEDLASEKRSFGHSSREITAAFSAISEEIAYDSYVLNNACPKHTSSIIPSKCNLLVAQISNSYEAKKMGFRLVPMTPKFFFGSLNARFSRGSCLKPPPPPQFAFVFFLYR